MSDSSASEIIFAKGCWIEVRVEYNFLNLMTIYVPKCSEYFDQELMDPVKSPVKWNNKHRAGHNHSSNSDSVEVKIIKDYSSPKRMAEKKEW